MRPAMLIGALQLILTAAGCRLGPGTPLAQAAADGRTAEVRALLASGADVNGTDGITALAWAARAGYVETMRVLLEHGADLERPSGTNGWTPLVHAIHKGQNPAALALLEAGAQAQGPSGTRALLMAAGYGNPEMVRALLEHGADPRVRAGGTNILTDAVGGAWDIDYQFTGCAGHTEAVRALLEAAPDLKLGDDFWSRRALAYAKKKGCADLVRLVAL